MTVIKINKTRGIKVNKNSYSLVEWKKCTKTLPDKTKEEYHVEYLWPSTFDRCIDLMTQEFVSDLNIVMTMEEFKKRYNEFLELIYTKINGTKTEILSKGYQKAQ